MHKKYVKILLKDYVESTYIREGQKSESMQKCIEVMDKMMKPNQIETNWIIEDVQCSKILYSKPRTSIFI